MSRKSASKWTHTGRLVALAAMLVSSGVAVQAQSGPPGPPPGPPGGRGMFRGGGPMGEDIIGFIGFEAGLGRATVTGSPFSATFSQQTTETLGDGNHIQRTTTGSLARDSNGRTHRDLTLPAIGPWATSGSTPPHVALITDPVAGMDYVLDVNRKVVREFPAPPPGKGGKGRGGPPPFVQERQNESTTVSLGTQMVNGVSAQGTRTTRTIPAGAFGNEKPIVITVERWYSPDLQMNVLIKRSDPRTGDNVFQLTNIVRSEPEASLFQVPSDYTVKQGRMKGKGGPGAAPPPPGD